MKMNTLSLGQFEINFEELNFELSPIKVQSSSTNPFDISAGLERGRPYMVV